MCPNATRDTSPAPLVRKNSNSAKSVLIDKPSDSTTESLPAPDTVTSSFWAAVERIALSVARTTISPAVRVFSSKLTTLPEALNPRTPDSPKSKSPKNRSAPDSASKEARPEPTASSIRRSPPDFKTPEPDKCSFLTTSSSTSCTKMSPLVTEASRLFARKSKVSPRPAETSTASAVTRPPSSIEIVFDASAETSLRKPALTSPISIEPSCETRRSSLPGARA